MVSIEITVKGFHLIYTPVTIYTYKPSKISTGQTYLQVVPPRRRIFNFQLLSYMKVFEINAMFKSKLRTPSINSNKEFINEHIIKLLKS